MDINNPPGTQNERELWHGTAADALDEIHSTGFNRGFCGKNGELWIRACTMTKLDKLRYGWTDKLCLWIVYTIYALCFRANPTNQYTYITRVLHASVGFRRAIHLCMKRVLYVVSVNLKHMYYTCHVKRVKAVCKTCYRRVLHHCWCFI